MNEILTGRCLCGAIRYRCGPVLYPPTLCHCESCRRASGAFPRDFASSPGVLRSFCGQCGTPLAYRAAQRPLEVDVTLCTLDDPERAAPADHIWMQDAPGWDLASAALPRFPQGRK